MSEARHEQEVRREVLLEVRKSHEIALGIQRNDIRQKEWVNRPYYEDFRGQLADHLGLSRAVSDWELLEAVEQLHIQFKAAKADCFGHNELIHAAMKEIETYRATLSTIAFQGYSIARELANKALDLYPRKPQKH